MKQVNAITQVTKALANQAPVANPYSLNSEVINCIQEFSGLVDKAGKAGEKLVDILRANGIKPHHFVAFNETEDKQGASFRDNVFHNIVIGWGDKVAEKLVFADPKTLKESDKAIQKVLRDKARKVYNNLKSALQRSYDNAEKKAKATPATKPVLALRAIKQAIKYLEDVKEGYTNMPSDIKALKALNILTCVKDSK